MSHSWIRSHTGPPHVVQCFISSSSHTLAEEHLWSTCWSLTPSITLHVYLVSNIYADCDNLYEYFFRHVSTTSCWGGEWQGLFVCLTWGNGGGYKLATFSSMERTRGTFTGQLYPLYNKQLRPTEYQFSIFILRCDYSLLIVVVVLYQYRNLYNIYCIDFVWIACVLNFPFARRWRW